jgi:hypothetical protein
MALTRTRIMAIPPLCRNVTSICVIAYGILAAVLFLTPKGGAVAVCSDLHKRARLLHHRSAKAGDTKTTNRLL